MCRYVPEDGKTHNDWWHQPVEPLLSPPVQSKAEPMVHTSEPQREGSQPCDSRKYHQCVGAQRTGHVTLEQTRDRPGPATTGAKQSGQPVKQAWRPGQSTGCINVSHHQNSQHDDRADQYAKGPPAAPAHRWWLWLANRHRAHAFCSVLNDHRLRSFVQRIRSRFPMRCASPVAQLAPVSSYSAPGRDLHSPPSAGPILPLRRVVMPAPPNPLFRPLIIPGPLHFET